MKNPKYISEPGGSPSRRPNNPKISPSQTTGSENLLVRRRLVRAGGPKTSRPGYEYLSCYKLGKVIQDLTHDFCQNFLKDPKDPNYPNYKLIDQMNGAARSNPQNVAEGHSQESLKSYIKLAGVAFGSNEELAKDFEDFLRQRKLQIWGKENPKIREFREFRAVWISQTSLNTPQLPQDPQIAANMLLTFCNMEGYLLKKLVVSLKQKHRTEGGLTENLYHARQSYRSALRAGKTRKEYRGY